MGGNMTGVHRGDSLPIPRLIWGVDMGDKTIRTGLRPGGKEQMGRLLRLLENGRLDPTPLTSHTFEFSELERAFYLMQTKADGIIKP
jgi:isopropanol dehydrogenase (NADP+)